MKKQLKNNKGFTILEVSIALTVTLIFSGATVLNLRTIAIRTQAKECSRNLLMIHQAVNNYCLDNVESYGTSVQLTDLKTEEYINSQESYVCPVHKSAYPTVFTYGIMPTCPDSISGHECSNE